MEILKITIFACLAVAALLPCGVKAQDCSAIADPTEVQMFVLGNQLVVVWQKPSNLVTCGFENVQHTVTYTGYQSEQDITTPDYYAYFDYYPYSCVPSVVTITTSSGDLSTSTRVEYYTETSKVDNLAVFKVENGTLVVSWSKPNESEYCDFVYLVTYQDENSDTVIIETTDLETDLGVSLSSCALATITVTPINKQYTGIAVSTGYEGDINPVRNYGLAKVAAEVIAQFSPPLDIENCDIIYEIREVEDDCYTKNVSVAAFNGRIYSPWTTESIETEIASLTDVSASVDGNVIEMSWTAPLDAETCSITYQVEFDGANFTTSESNLAFEVEALEACGSMTISVSAVSSTGKVGVASYVAVQGQLGAIQNLVMESLQEGSALVATWDAPENSSSCTLSYLLEYTNGAGSHIYVTTNNTYTFAYEPCIEVTLSVTPHSEDGSQGPNATITLTANIEAVTELIADVQSDQLVVSWSHSKANTCPFEYKVNYRIDGVVIAEAIVGVTIKSFDYVYCVDADISVIPTINSEDGPEIRYPVPAEFPQAITEKVTNVVITPDDDTQQLTWDDLVIGRCSVVYNVQIISYGIHETHYNEESPYSIPDEEICYNLDARVAAGIDIGTEIIYGPVSDSIATTVDIEAVTDLTVDVVSDQLEISWSHSKANTCHFEYKVNYIIDDVVIAEVIQGVPTKSFDYVYCVDAVVSVIPIINSEDGPEITYPVPAEYPTSAAVEFATIVTEDGKQILRWEEIQIEACDVTYDIDIISEELPTTPHERTAYGDFEIPNGEFCYNVIARITPRFGTYTGEGFDTERKIVSIEKPESLELTPTDTALVARWEHDLKQGYCSISYDVSYQYGSNLPLTVQDITLDTYNIPREYCTDVNVIVTAISGSESSEPATETFKADEPSLVGQVKNLGMEINGGNAFITWNSPEYVNYCTDIIYAVTATNSATDYTECTGQPCSLFLSTYCPETIITVLAISMNGSPLAGATATTTYTCDGTES